jgi:hypothetical protein
MYRFNTIFMLILVLAPLAVVGIPMHPIDYCINYHINMPFNMVDYMFAPIIFIIIFSLIVVLFGVVVNIKNIEYGIIVSTGVIILSYPLIYGNIPNIVADLWKVAKVIMICFP